MNNNNKIQIARPETLTFEELKRACANVGVNLTCGACAEIFYTGSTQAEHICVNLQEYWLAVNKEIEGFLAWAAEEFGAKLVFTCDKVRTNVTEEEIELMIERFKEQVNGEE